MANCVGHRTRGGKYALEFGCEALPLGKESLARGDRAGQPGPYALGPECRTLERGGMAPFLLDVSRREHAFACREGSAEESRVIRAGVRLQSVVIQETARETLAQITIWTT